MSPLSELLLGRSAAQLRGGDVLDLVHPDDLEEAGARLAAVEHGTDGVRPHALLRLRRGDGGWRWFEIKGTDLRSVPGVDGIVLAARDVEHRVALQAELSVAQRRFEALVRNSADGTLVLGDELRITYASPAVERITGWSNEQLVGADVSTFVVEPSRALLAEYARATASGPDRELTTRARVQHRDGTPRWLEVRTSNHVDDPAVDGIIANLRDVTDSVEAEEVAPVSARSST